MTRSLYTCTVSRTGGHVQRYAVRIGRRDDEGEMRLTLSTHNDLADAEAARDRARRHPDVAWRQAERAAETRAREFAARRTLGKRGRDGERSQSVIPTDASPRRVAFETLSYEDDIEAQLFVQAFPQGATLEMVGDWLGVSRERVRQMEGDALVSLARELRRRGITESCDHGAIVWVDEGGW